MTIIKFLVAILMLFLLWQNLHPQPRREYREPSPEMLRLVKYHSATIIEDEQTGESYFYREGIRCRANGEAR
jgi:hypothetical protein